MNPLKCEMTINGKVENRCSEFRCDTSREIRVGDGLGSSRSWVSSLDPNPRAVAEFTLMLTDERNAWHPLPVEKIEVVITDRDERIGAVETLTFKGVVEDVDVRPHGDSGGMIMEAHVIARGRAEYEVGEDFIVKAGNIGSFDINANDGESFVAFVPETDYGYTPGEYAAEAMKAFSERMLPANFNCRCVIDCGWPVWEPDDSDFVLNWDVYDDDWIIGANTLHAMLERGDFEITAHSNGGRVGISDQFVRQMAGAIAENIDNQIMRALAPGDTIECGGVKYQVNGADGEPMDLTSWTASKKGNTLVLTNPITEEHITIGLTPAQARVQGRTEPTPPRRGWLDVPRYAPGYTEAR